MGLKDILKNAGLIGAGAAGAAMISHSGADVELGFWRACHRRSKVRLLAAELKLSPDGRRGFQRLLTVATREELDALLAIDLIDRCIAHGLEHAVAQLSGMSDQELAKHLAAFAQKTAELAHVT